MKRFFAATLVLFVLLVAGGVITRPTPLSTPVVPIEITSDSDTWLQQKEDLTRERYGLVDGAEKRITWAGSSGTRTEYAVVYLHGFSATRQEIAPVPAQVAELLGANLFETRLAGHGRLHEQLDGVVAEDWLNDGAEALAIGHQLGDKLVVIGVSTGATLALTLAEHPDFRAVDTLVLISPNWAPAAAGSGIATGPYGPQLTRLFAGEERRWTAANDLQEKYWTTRYPTESIIEMMRLVDLANAMTASAEVPRALLIYSPLDDVVSVQELLSGFERLPARRKATLVVEEPRSLSPHVLTGAILGPEEVAPTVEAIVGFLRGT